MKKSTTLIIVGLVIIAILVVLLAVISDQEKAEDIFVGQGDVGIIEKATQTQNSKKYRHQEFGFSFEYPENYSVGGFKEGIEGEVVLVQSDDNNSEKGFQIFINPISEAITLTPEFITSDLPDVEVRGPKKITLDNKAEGILFFSNNNAFGGESFEIWFINKNRVYQISSYASYANDLQNIIGTWRFE